MVSAASLTGIDALVPAAGLSPGDLAAETVLRHLSPQRGFAAWMEQEWPGRRGTLRRQWRWDIAGRGYERPHVWLEGLWADAPATIQLTMSAKSSRRVGCSVNGVPAATLDVGRSPADYTLAVRADAAGQVRLDFENPATGEWRAPRILDLTVRQARPARITWTRIGLYAAIGGLGALVLALTLGCGPSMAVGAALLVALSAAGLWVARLQTQAILRVVVILLGVALGWVLLGEILRRVAAIAQKPARWIALGITCRLLLAFWPSFMGADWLFHLHRLGDFRRGIVVSSVAPGLDAPLPVPYPPLLYALLNLVTLGGRSPLADEWALRLVAGLSEAVVPLLVLLMMRKGGARESEAATAAVLAAAMPEGVLAVAKGIAANSLGGVAILTVALALQRRAHWLVTAGLLALALLSHLGVAMSLTTLLLCHWLWEWGRGTRSAPWLLSRLGLLASAALVAATAYYGEVLGVLWSAAGSVGAALDGGGDSAGFGFHGLRLGKIAQDVLLKFGGTVLLILAWRRQGEVRAVERLLWAWLLAGFAQAVLAVFTPITLRFELFLVPAVAGLAAMGAGRLESRGHAWVVTSVVTLAFAIQVALVVAVLTDWFEIINVVLESPRWPLLAPIVLWWTA